MTTISTSGARQAVAETLAADERPPARILVADTLEKVGVNALESLGCQITFKPELAAEDIPGAVSEHDPEILIVRGTKVTREVFEQAQALSLVIRAGAGCDAIDLATASARGVFVTNCPGKNAIAVAELAWSLILSCDRRVPDQTAELRAGRWNKSDYAEAAGLYGRTLGIIGLGQIGQEIAIRGRGFGMKVVAWSRSLTEERADALGVGYCSNLINLAKMSDVVSVSVAATDETRHLINEQFCQALRDGAYLINTSRGSVVDEDALRKALREKNIRAGLDVFANEPGGGTGEFTDDLVHEAGVYGTHHVGASTMQAQESIAVEAARIVEHYLSTGEALNCVNLATSIRATHLLTVRHLNRPGVLAHVFYTLGQSGINVEEMENIIYSGAEAACARIQLDRMATAEQLNAIRANDNVLSAESSRIAP